MTSNLGNVDRAVRILLGLGLVSLVFIGPKTYFGLVGLVLIITAFISFCPIYRIFGLRTCKA